MDPRAVLVASWLALTAAGAAAQASAFACVPFDRLVCGCQIRIDEASCKGPSSPRQPHFFTDLGADAPLLFFLNDVEHQLAHVRHEGIAKGERGGSWTDVDRGGGIQVLLRYAPGPSTCPPGKAQGCEYADER